MYQYIYFIAGMIMSIIVIKLLLPRPIQIKIFPTLTNYDKIIYVDEEGKKYKYTIELVE